MSGNVHLTNEVRAVLEAARVTGTRLELVGHLDRALYLKVAKAIETMGGKWSRKHRAHVFEEDAEEVVADAIATGTVVDLKKLYQFFETPPYLADRLVDKAKIVRGMEVLEPSAGNGNIVDALLAIGATVFCCEIQERCVSQLLRRADDGCDLRFLSRDFLTLVPDPDCMFDAVVANPPFARGQDVEHVSHMLKFVRPGGTLVSVMSPAWTFRMTAKHKQFRAVVQHLGAEWTELDAGTFHDAGTDVRTGILSITLPSC